MRILNHKEVMNIAGGGIFELAEDKSQRVFNFRIFEQFSGVVSPFNRDELRLVERIFEFEEVSGRSYIHR